MNTIRRRVLKLMARGIVAVAGLSSVGAFVQALLGSSWS